MNTYTQFFPTQSKGCGSILLVHGAGEHLDRYRWLIRRWNEAGYDVFGGDLPGYGRSDGKKGHIQRFEDYIEAVDSWYEQLKQTSTGQPFIFGHSLGGLIVARFVEIMQPKSAGVILSSPCFALKLQVPFWKESLAKVLNVLYPSLVLSSGVKAEYTTRSLEILKEYSADPLNTKGASIRWYRELLLNMEKNSLDASRFPSVPLLIYQAGEDKLVDPKKVRKWFEDITIVDKTYKEWQGLYHEIFNEPEREDVFKELLEWMTARS